MSGLQFVVDVIKALAWPAAIVAIVVFLRRPLGDILRQLASGLRRLRAGQSDAEFDRIVTQTKAELTATVSARGPAPSMPVLLRFATTADEDPAAAIAQAFGSVEAALRGLLGSSGKLVPVGSGDPTAVARFARDQGLVPESIVRAVDGVVTLRNAVAADPARATRDHAVTFLALVDALLFAITTQREWSVAGPSPMS
jgi:Sec-independent protein translocase protein TatA